MEESGDRRECKRGGNQTEETIEESDDLVTSYVDRDVHVACGVLTAAAIGVHAFKDNKGDIILENKSSFPFDMEQTKVPAWQVGFDHISGSVDFFMVFRVENLDILELQT